MYRIIKRICGFLIGLLFSFSVAGQSFFEAATLSHLPSYGSVKTRLLPANVIGKIEEANLTDAQFAAFFFLESGGHHSKVGGSYQIDNGQIIFTPSQSPDPSLQYLVTFSFPKLAEVTRIEAREEAYSELVSFKPPASTIPSVSGISPQITLVPINILRVYLNLSAPMGEADPYSFIHLIDDLGEELENPFVKVPGGLWNIDKTRLTLLFHPERLGQSNAGGDVLERGRTYTLKIDKQWKGASGESLNQEKQFTLTAVAPVRRKVAYRQWALQATQAQLGELTITTTRPLDQALASRMLFVRERGGTIIPSQVIFLSPTRIQIRWHARATSQFELLIDPRLEDYCGNTPMDIFDYKNEGDQSTATNLVIIPFTAR